MCFMGLFEIFYVPQMTLEYNKMQISELIFMRRICLMLLPSFG